MGKTKRMKGAEALIRALEEEGVEYIFGIPGHANMQFLDAIHNGSSIKFMLTRHEQGAVHIADGYARVSGKTGVCMSSVGAGAANMLMGIGVAGGGSSPVLAINGGIIGSMYGKGQLQATERPEGKSDQSYVQVLQPLVKKAWVVERPELIPDAVHRAIRVAHSGRPGPVAMEVAWDIQSQYCDYPDTSEWKREYAKRIRAGEEETRRAAEMLAAAKYPVIVAGNGAVISEAENEVVKLAEALGAPVVTSYMSKGVIPGDHPLSAGMAGWLGHPAAHEILREKADVVLAVGYRFSDEGTSFWTEGLPFVPENKFIQIDLVPEEIGRNYPVEVGLVGDAKAVLADILAHVEKLPPRPGKDAVADELAGIIARCEAAVTVPQGVTSPVEPMQIAMAIRKVMPENGIVVTDTGNHSQYFAPFFKTKGRRRLICPGSWTPMGFSPAAVIGAKLAEPETPCLAVVGDGGFYMMCQEVITAVDFGTPVVWVVFNNKTLNAIRIGQIDDYNNHIIGTEFKSAANFAEMAKSFGAEGVRVESSDQLEEALTFALNCGKPCVVDVVTQTDPIPPQGAGDFLTPGQHIPVPVPRKK